MGNTKLQDVLDMDFCLDWAKSKEESYVIDFLSTENFDCVRKGWTIDEMVEFWHERAGGYSEKQIRAMYAAPYDAENEGPDWSDVVADTVTMIMNVSMEEVYEMMAEHLYEWYVVDACPEETLEKLNEEWPGWDRDGLTSLTLMAMAA